MLQFVSRARCLLLLTPLLVLWPVWLHPGAALIGDEGLDAWSHAWGLHWFYASLVAGRLPWRVDGLAWPDGGTLWYIDPLGALVSLPFQAAFGTVIAYNAVLAIQVLLAGFAGARFGRALGGTGLVAGFGLATAPFLQSELHNGIAEAGWVGLVPLAAAAAVRGSRWTGPLIGLAWLATPYHGLSAAVVAGSLLLLSPDGAPVQERIKRLGIAALLAVILAIPVLYGLESSLHAADALARKPVASLDNLPVFRVNAVDPLALIHPGDFWSVRLEPPLEAPFRRTPYLGLGLLGLSLVAVSGRRRLAWLLLPAGGLAVLSLGPYLWRNGDFVSVGGQLVALPFAALLKLGVSIDHPLRLIGCSITILAGLADLAIPARHTPLRPNPALPVAVALPAALLIVIEHLALAPNCWPLHSADAEIPAVYALLPADGRAIIDLPAERGDSLATNRYLYWQSVHGRGIPYAAKVGRSGFPSENAALRALVRLGDLGDQETLAELDPDALRPALDELASQGFGWVLLHEELLARPELASAHRKLLDPLLGPPRSLRGALVWEIRAGQKSTQK